jgi:hypothetical protein
LNAANEILMSPGMTLKAQNLLRAMAATAPPGWAVVERPSGAAVALMAYGAGQVERKQLLDAHRARGGRLVLWDVGYFAQGYAKGYLRMSVDHNHPQHLLDLAPLDSSRWDALGLSLRNDASPRGPTILVGMGPKSQVHDAGWEIRTFHKLRKKDPVRRIIFRPKPRRAHPRLPCPTDARSSIEQVLKGASLVVTKHSNVALDAVLAGVPIQCEDGAAKWLDGKEYTPQNRLELLWRVMWFNYRAEEAALAWTMIDKCLGQEA